MLTGGEKGAYFFMIWYKTERLPEEGLGCAVLGSRHCRVHLTYTHVRHSAARPSLTASAHALSLYNTICPDIFLQSIAPVPRNSPTATPKPSSSRPPATLLRRVLPSAYLPRIPFGSPRLRTYHAQTKFLDARIAFIFQHVTRSDTSSHYGGCGFAEYFQGVEAWIGSGWDSCASFLRCYRRLYFGCMRLPGRSTRSMSIDGARMRTQAQIALRLSFQDRLPPILFDCGNWTRRIAI